MAHSDNPSRVERFRAEAAYRKASAQFQRASRANARYRSPQTEVRLTRAYRQILEAYDVLDGNRILDAYAGRAQS